MSITVDGGIGEGGGSIVRLCFGLAVLTRRQIHIQNIRKNRDNPGLRAQHLAGLESIYDLFGGDLFGAEIGSTSVRYSPLLPP
ncbi:MAG TPA: RNA 3'-terminal phosphate cyclase, partial [Candidatus Hodarchaeales archaeon]|nr:RNA 3'-terminal phosphate cyclase [Candidatus Hodarchaeales archaeon]